MPTFAVYPSDDASGQCVWVNAKTEADARWLVSLNVPSHRNAIEESAFECRQDEKYDLPYRAVILCDGGHSITVKNV